MAASVLAGCGASTNAVPTGADLSPIVVERPETASPSSAPDSGNDGPDAPGGAASAGAGGGDTPSPVTDPRADLDIDDQVGTGRSVVIEAVDTELAAVHVVIEARYGRVLGSDLRTAGVQPVTLRLDVPVPGPTELVGRMLVDDGDGILEVGVDPPVIDDQGEQVAEDFDYALSPAQLTDD